MLFAASSDGGTAAGVILVFIIFGGGLYLLPTIVAAVRKVPNLGSVIVINLFLGWSLIGWVVAMAMAARSHPTAGQQVHVYTGQNPVQGGQHFVAPPQVGQPQAGPPSIAPANAGPAGWHADPHGEKRLRYFDGSTWTAHVAD